MVSLNSLLLFACMFVCSAQAQVTTTLVSKKFAFEKVCWDYYGTPVAQYYKIRDKSICGTKCAQFGTCNAFLYNQNAGYCRLNTDFFLNMTNVGCSSLADYGESTEIEATGLKCFILKSDNANVKTLDPLRFAPDPGLYCIGACTNAVNGFRLCDGGGAGVCNPMQGRLEVFYNNAWGTVCDDNWEVYGYNGPQNSAVACRMFGYSSGEAKAEAFFGQGVGQIMLDEILCGGSELSLLDCSHSPWFSNDCSHSEDTGVICHA